MAFFMNEKFTINEALNSSELKFLIDYYKSRTDYIITNGMKKYPVITNPINHEFINFIDSIIVKKLNINDYVLLGDNFYEHEHSYFPHCDAVQENSWLNIVIPLKLYNPIAEQKFLVFDQKYSGGGATWMGSYKMKNDFLFNKKIDSIITETPNVEGTTNLKINENFYAEFDTRFLPEEYMFGTSGTVFSWVPGDIIVFNSKFIHSTGKMKCNKKLGLSIRIGHKK